MSYYLYDSDGYVGDIASNMGMIDLYDFLNMHARGELRKFITRGWVEVGEKLQADVDKMPEPHEETVRETWENLKDLFTKCSEVAIISDGVD